MIQSMTAFGRKEIQGDKGSIAWELRGVNQRFLEVNLRLPESMYALEPLLRERLKARIQRGKIDISLRYQPPAGQSQLRVNHDLVTGLVAAHAEIVSQERRGSSLLEPAEILKWPGVLMAGEVSVNQLQGSLMAVFEEALEDLIASRHREGKVLKALMLERLSGGKRVSVHRHF